MVITTKTKMCENIAFIGTAREQKEWDDGVVFNARATALER